MSDQQTQNQRRGAPVGDRPSSATLSTRFGRIGIDIQNVEMFQQLLNLVGVIYADREDLRPLIFDSLLVFDLAGNAQHQMAAWEDLQLNPNQLDVLADVLASVDDARETFGTEHVMHPLLNAVHRLIDSAVLAGTKLGEVMRPDVDRTYRMAAIEDPALSFAEKAFGINGGLFGVIGDPTDFRIALIKAGCYLVERREDWLITAYKDNRRCEFYIITPDEESTELIAGVCWNGYFVSDATEVPENLRKMAVCRITAHDYLIFDGGFKTLDEELQRLGALKSQ